MSPQNEGNETKGNDSKLKKPLIVRLILQINNTGNVYSMENNHTDVNLLRN